MTTINTNVASLIAFNNLTNSQHSLQTSLTRLSTGLKINSGADDPAGLVASNILSSQISSINQSITNSNRANDVLSTADAGLGQISGLLDQIRSLVQSGLNSGALSSTELGADQNQIDQALSAINKVAANTTFAGDQLIDGSKAYTTQVSSADAAKLNSYQLNAVTFSGASTVPVTATVKTAATQGQLFYNFTNGGLASNTTIEVSGASGTNVLFLGSGSSLSDIKSAVNNVSNVTGVTATHTAAVYGTATFGTVASNNGLTFTDIRSQATNPDQATGNAQTLKIDIAAAAATNTLSVTSASTANSLTLTITLGTDGSGNVTSTASDVKALIAANANSSGFVSVTLDGNGTGTVVGGQGPTNVTTGAKNGSLTFQSQDFGSSQFVGLKVLQGTLVTNQSSVGGTASSRSTGTDIVATINGQAAVGSGLSASVTGSALDASVTFNAADNVAATTATITVTGGGSIFQIGQNANVAGQISLGLPAINTAELGGTAGKLFQLGSGGGLSLLDLGPTTPGSKLVSIITDAINQVSTLSGRIGALQANVIQTNIATLNSALQNVSQANADIADTNFAQETSNLARAQILQSSGISVLSIANQTPQAVLKLLP
ncbi:MAG TPA: flagellin [Planctomycetaceae bacterium]|jgi:flagellin|nr:flagellin [Planctomycetaceae bacterium]